MKLKRYILVALMVSSSFCYGLNSSRIKHTTIGVGKLGLAALCAYMGTSTYNRKMVELEWDCKDIFKDKENSDVFFQDRNSILMNYHVNMATTFLFFTGACAYGACRGIYSAGKSFKEAWNAGKKPSSESATQSSSLDSSQDETKKEEDIIFLTTDVNFLIGDEEKS